MECQGFLLKWEHCIKCKYLCHICLLWVNSKAITRVSKKVTTNEFGLVGSYDLIPNGSVINIVSVKAYLPSDKIEVRTESHTYSNYSFFRVINSNGDYLKNTELDFIIFYMK